MKNNVEKMNMHTTVTLDRFMVHHDAALSGKRTARKRSKVIAAVVQFDKPYKQETKANAGQTIGPASKPSMNFGSKLMIVRSVTWIRHVVSNIARVRM
jgi:hypothetical protein